MAPGAGREGAGGVQGCLTGHDTPASEEMVYLVELLRCLGSAGTR